MRLRKKIQRSINYVEAKLLADKLSMDWHKNYFDKMLNKNSYLTLALLLPTFLAGWKEGKKFKYNKKGLKRFFGFIATITLSAISNKNLLNLK